MQSGTAETDCTWLLNLVKHIASSCSSMHDFGQVASAFKIEFCKQLTTSQRKKLCRVATAWIFIHYFSSNGRLTIYLPSSWVALEALILALAQMLLWRELFQQRLKFSLELQLLVQCSARLAVAYSISCVHAPRLLLLAAFRSCLGFSSRCYQMSLDLSLGYTKKQKQFRRRQQKWISQLNF